MVAFPAPSELTQRQLRGLLRLGDVLIPGDDDLPSFSASGCAPQIATVLPHLHESDRSSLLDLLSACATAPRPALKALIAGAGAGPRLGPGVFGGTLRMANIGIKGVLFSLYYADVSGAGIRERLDWQAEIAEETS